MVATMLAKNSTSLLYFIESPNQLGKLEKSYSLFLTRLLLFRPRLNIPIFLPFLENIFVPFLKKKEFIMMLYAVLFISFVV